MERAAFEEAPRVGAARRAASPQEENCARKLLRVVDRGLRRANRTHDNVEPQREVLVQVAAHRDRPLSRSRGWKRFLRQRRAIDDNAVKRIHARWPSTAQI